MQAFFKKKKRIENEKFKQTLSKKSRCLTCGRLRAWRGLPATSRPRDGPCQLFGALNAAVTDQSVAMGAGVRHDRADVELAAAVSRLALTVGRGAWVSARLTGLLG